MSWEKKDDPNKNTQKVKTYPPCECEFWLIDANFLTLGRIHGGLGYVYIYINTKNLPNNCWSYDMNIWFEGFIVSSNLLVGVATS
jgi:hypothetical protein